MRVHKLVERQVQPQRGNPHQQLQRSLHEAIPGADQKRGRKTTLEESNHCGEGYEAGEGAGT